MGPAGFVYLLLLLAHCVPMTSDATRPYIYMYARERTVAITCDSSSNVSSCHAKLA